MPEPDKFTAFVMEQFAPLGRIREKYMFGGWCLYCDETPFALISGKGKLYLKADGQNRALFEERGLKAFPVSGGKTLSYYEAPAEVLENSGSMMEWCGPAVAAGRRKKKRK